MNEVSEDRMLDDHPSDPAIETVGPLVVKTLAVLGGGAILSPVVLALALPFLASN